MSRFVLAALRPPTELWFALFFTSFFLMPFATGRLPAAGPEGYAGYRECDACHEEIVRDWLKTPHARALESLKKTSQEGLPACLTCHVTGYEKAGGYVDFEITPELAGVQCEECHGPARAHASEPGEKSGLAPRPGEKKCRTCHTPGQDPNFSYEKKVKGVHQKQ